QFGNLTIPIADGAYEIRDRVLPEPEHPDVPRGMVWNLNVLESGALTGGVLFNLNEFDELTVAGWVADLARILSAAVKEPDRTWPPLWPRRSAAYLGCPGTPPGAPRVNSWPLPHTWLRSTVRRGACGGTWPCGARASRQTWCSPSATRNWRAAQTST